MKNGIQTKMSKEEFEKLPQDQKMSTIFGALIDIDERLDNGEKMFAGKWVEKGIVGAIVFVLVAVGGAVLAIVGLHSTDTTSAIRETITKIS